MGARASTCLGLGRRPFPLGTTPKPEPDPEAESEAGRCWAGLVRLVPGARCLLQEDGAAPQLREQPDHQRRPARAKTSPPVATHGDLPMLEAQASKLRATIRRRTACAGASAEPDNVAAVVAHYGAVLAEIEEQIGQLKGAPSQEATQVPVAADEPTPAVPASGQAATGKEHLSEPGSPSVVKRPAADSVSTVATARSACSSTGELPAVSERMPLTEEAYSSKSSACSSTSELQA